MRSMTGFGAGEAKFLGGRIVAEARSLNHRFLELRVRLASEMAEHSFFVEQLCRERLLRGRYDVCMQLETAQGAAGIDRERARSVYRELSALRDELAPGTELPITVLSGIPELFAVRPLADVEAVRDALTRALDQSLLSLDAMRSREGEVLRAEFSDRLDRIRSLTGEIERLSPEVTATLRTRLRDRVGRLVADTGTRADPYRMEMEVAILADRADVTEELVRMKSHLAQFEALLGSAEPVGRRLDFLLQEMGRETNTLGAKCHDAGLSHLVVELKAELSRVREQVQNVE